MKQAFRCSNKQHGMTMISWVALLALVGIFALALIKLTPVYLEYYTVVSTLKGLSQDPNLKGKGRVEIQSSFVKRLDINDVTSVTKDNYTIKKVKGKKSYLVEVNYEVMKPLLGNVSLHVAFQNSAEVGE